MSLTVQFYFPLNERTFICIIASFAENKDIIMKCSFEGEKLSVVSEKFMP